MDALQDLWNNYQPYIVAGLVALGVLAGTALKDLSIDIIKNLAKWIAALAKGSLSHYRFEKLYLKQIVGTHQFIKLRGIARSTISIELEKIYIQPQLARIIVILKDTPESYQRRTVANQIASPEQEEEALSLDQAIQKFDRLIVLGAPGSGKSTLLAYLVLVFARGQAKKTFKMNTYLPIYVTLRDFKTETKSLDEYLRQYLEENMLHVPHKYFQRALEQGRCIVLLDGLDEVSDHAQRARVANWVEQLVNAWPGNRYIVTSRPVGYSAAPLSQGFQEISIQDFGIDEIQQFASKWSYVTEYVADNTVDPKTIEQRSQARSQALMSAIYANDRVSRIATNPLLLSIVTLVYQYRGSLPTQRAELYQECTMVLLDYWDTAKGIVGEMRPDQKRAILEPLALEMHKRGVRELGYQDIVQLIEHELPKVGKGSEQAEAFLLTIRERSGLLEERGLKLYGFSHLTFQEYLAAGALVKANNYDSFLAGKSHDSWWREITLLYGSMKDATGLIKILLSTPDDIFKSNLSLAAQCLTEATTVEPEVRSQISAQLVELFCRTPYRRIRDMAQQALAHYSWDLTILVLSNLRFTTVQKICSSVTFVQSD